MTRRPGSAVFAPPDRLAGFDFAAHNAEVKAMWAAFSLRIGVKPAMASPGAGYRGAGVGGQESGNGGGRSSR